jgi:hypothetical protein
MTLDKKKNVFGVNGTAETISVCEDKNSAETEMDRN